MKEIATSRYGFAALRENGHVYVDKTDILAKLAKNEGMCRNIDVPKFETP